MAPQAAYMHEDSRVWSCNPAGLALATQMLETGKLIIYPTETFYALGAWHQAPEAIGALRQSKARPDVKALPLIAADIAAAWHFMQVQPWARALAEALWPGPLTLVGTATSALPGILHGVDGTVAIRVTSHLGAAQLARACGGILISTSANKSGAPPARRVEALDARLCAEVGGIVNDGELTGGLPSTIVDATGDALRILRQGAMIETALRVVLRP